LNVYLAVPKLPFMISIAEAAREVRERASLLAMQSVKLEDALRRILAEDITADCDLPPFDRSQMDGYAVRAADVQATPANLDRKSVV